MRPLETVGKQDMNLKKTITSIHGTTWYYADLHTPPPSARDGIDVDERKVLPRKHGSFQEEEVLEPSKLFYASLGASSVKVDKFMDAFDAAAERSAKGGGPTGPLDVMAAKVKLKTHPLGIGTCASEYS